MIDAGRGFEKALRLLKKDFGQNVGPSLRRHQFAVGPQERDRLKHYQAIRKRLKDGKRSLERREAWVNRNWEKANHYR